MRGWILVIPGSCIRSVSFFTSLRSISSPAAINLRILLLLLSLWRYLISSRIWQSATGNLVKLFHDSKSSESSSVSRPLLVLNLPNMLFALSTLNAPKTQALREALSDCPYVLGHEVEILGFKVPSGVPEMPMNLRDIRTGAKNRVQEVRLLCPEADFLIGMEAGIYTDSVGTESWLMGTVYIEDKQGKWYSAYTCHIPVPEAIMLGLNDGSGRDIDEIVESLWAPPDTSHGCGVFGIFTDMMLSRGNQFRLATQCAIAPFFNKFYRL